MKTIKGVFGSFALLIIAGVLVTITTRSVISQKREELYDYQSINAETSTTDHNIGETTSGVQSGPMSGIMTKEKYLEQIHNSEEYKDIAYMWETITDTNGSSAISVVRYEMSFWESRLSEILQMYYEIQSVENVDALRLEEEEFAADRENLAREAAKAAGEAFDGLAYNKEYVRLTKEKTYEYIDRYFSEE